MSCPDCTEFLVQGSGTVGEGTALSYEKVVVAEDPDNIPLVLLSVKALDKDDVLLVDQTPAWLEATSSGASVLVGSRLVYRLTVTVEIDAFRVLDPASGDPAEWGEGTYTIELRAQVEDGSKPVIVCLFDVCITGTVPEAAQVAFITSISPSELWSGLAGGPLTMIRTGIEWQATTYAALSLLRVSLDGEDAIVFMTDENASAPEVRKIGFTGLGEVLIASPGGTNLADPAIMVTFPPGNTEADIAYWYTQRRGWTPVSGGFANWGTTSFGVQTMAAYDLAADDDNMIVRNSGSNPFDLRDYKTGVTIVNTTGNFNNGLKSDRTRTRIFGLNSQDLLEINPVTLATISTSTMNTPGAAVGLIGVDIDADLVYLFESDSGNFISTCRLDGTFVEKVTDLTALGIVAALFSGVLF